MADEEYFRVYDENEQPQPELVARSVVHRLGLYHRTVDVFVFNSQGQMLLQRRSASKDVCPNRWDISCAEHLKPDEPFKDGAIRGLKEELNIELQPEQIATMELLRPTVLFRHAEPSKGIVDNEFKQVWKVIYDGPFQVDNDEVTEAKFVSMSELRELFHEHSDDLTTWAKDDLAILNL